MKYVIGRSTRYLQWVDTINWSDWTKCIDSAKVYNGINEANKDLKLLLGDKSVEGQHNAYFVHQVNIVD